MATIIGSSLTLYINTNLFKKLILVMKKSHFLVLVPEYRVFRLVLIYFEDLGDHLKITFRL